MPLARFRRGRGRGRLRVARVRPPGQDLDRRHGGNQLRLLDDPGVRDAPAPQVLLQLRRQPPHARVDPPPQRVADADGEPGVGGLPGLGEERLRKEPVAAGLVGERSGPAGVQHGEAPAPDAPPGGAARLRGLLRRRRRFVGERKVAPPEQASEHPAGSDALRLQRRKLPLQRLDLAILLGGGRPRVRPLPRKVLLAGVDEDHGVLRPADGLLPLDELDGAGVPQDGVGMGVGAQEPGRQLLRDDTVPGEEHKQQVPRLQSFARRADASRHHVRIPRVLQRLRRVARAVREEVAHRAGVRHGAGEGREVPVRVDSDEKAFSCHGVGFP